jgi:hypothetical protein
MNRIDQYSICMRIPYDFSIARAGRLRSMLQYYLCRSSAHHVAGFSSHTEPIVHSA